MSSALPPPARHLPPPAAHLPLPGGHRLDRPRPPAGRPVVLCADDYALSEGVSEGIVRLAEAGRLSAISCMTISPLWPALAPHLQAISQTCDVGLHLTLTDQEPLQPLPRLAASGRLPDLRRLLTLALRGRLAADELNAEIEGEIDRQWRAFIAACGRPPDFVDGHQHVHLLAGVRERVCERLARLPAADRPYLRVCWEPPAAVLRRGIATGKALLLAVLSRPLRRQALSLGIAGNDSFRGVHAFDPATPFAPLMQRFLAGAGDQPLVMCHPGLVDACLRTLDPVTDQRRVEYDYLSSQQFTDDLAAAGMRLARFRDVPPQTGPAPAEAALR